MFCVVYFTWWWWWCRRSRRRRKGEEQEEESLIKDPKHDSRVRACNDLNKIRVFVRVTILTRFACSCVYRRSSRRRWQSKSPREESGNTRGARRGQRRASSLRRCLSGNEPSTAASANYDQAGHSFPHLVLVGGRAATAAPSPSDFATL